MENPKLFIATKAFINYQEKTLILRESLTSENKFDPGRYDVVGGRIAPGLNLFQSLLKEVKEQTNLDITIKRPFYVDEITPKNDKENWHVICIYFDCEAITGEIKLTNDYDNFEWIRPEEFKRYYLYKELHNAFLNYLEFVKNKKIE